MADHPVHHVTLSLDHGFEFVATFDDLPDATPVRLDEPAPPGGGHGPHPPAPAAGGGRGGGRGGGAPGPTAGARGGGAAGTCLAASLFFCLRKSRASVGSLTA